MLIKIASRDNPRLKNARKIRDGKIHDRIFIEGARLVAEALSSRLKIDQAFVSSEEGAGFAELLADAGVTRIYELSAAVFQTIADTVSSQGVVVIAERSGGSETAIEDNISSATVPLVVFLNRINNPSNLGAVVRTAEAAGAAGVIISDESADAFSSKALRASMGSAFRLPIWQGVSFENALAWAKDHGIRAVAADVDADHDHVSFDWTARRMLVMGSEAHGLSDDERRRVDDLIRIPMEREVESLNLAVATGVILYEARRQQQV
jgi:RNA methyltransferase, TrmH family